MNNTEAKILEKSLELYNEKGIDSITVRHIGTYMGIRHSNITYYYPKKNDIIEALYRIMQEEVDKVISKFESKSNELFDTSLFSSLFDVLYKYRFVEINRSEIFKRLPELKDLYDANKESRRNRLRLIISNLQKEGVLKNELTKNSIEMFLINVELINDFWVVYCDLNPEKKEEEQKNFYIKLIMNSFMPFLTPKGLVFFVKKMEEF